MNKNNRILRVKLTVKCGVVLMQVLEQNGFERGIIIEHDDIDLYSVGYPVLYPDTVYIRGAKRWLDNAVATFTPENPESYIYKVTALIESVGGIVEVEK